MCRFPNSHTHNIQYIEVLAQGKKIARLASTDTFIPIQNLKKHDVCTLHSLKKNDDDFNLWMCERNHWFEHTLTNKIQSWTEAGGTKRKKHFIQKKLVEAKKITSQKHILWEQRDDR